VADSASPPLLDAATLRASVAAAGNGCAHCGHLQCAGWESITGPLKAPLLEHVGSLRDPVVEDPTLQEHHPEGTGYWSPQAPVATAWFPYNRCEVWRCPSCRRGFLQYTEFGGYYVDHRLRAIDPALVV
jgi:hypothetical protein